MSFFKVNHNEATSFGPIPEGTYEAIISNIEIKTFVSGSRGLAITYTIRNDVAQEGQKRKVFENAPVLESTMFKFQNLAKATSLPDGANFNSEDELLQGFSKHLKGKPVRITITHDNTRDKFIEQVAGVAPTTLGITGASTISAPSPIVAPPVDTFNLPGLNGIVPPPSQAGAGEGTSKFPWEQ